MPDSFQKVLHFSFIPCWAPSGALPCEPSSINVKHKSQVIDHVICLYLYCQDLLVSWPTRDRLFIALIQESKMQV